jgi:hypothetical protein
VLISLVLSTEAHRKKRGHSMQHQQTERPKDQRPLHLCATGKLFPPDKEEDDHTRGHLFCFSLSFHLFTTNITRALFLEAIKGPRKTPQDDSDRHTHHPLKETWDPLHLSKACNPYYKHFGARQHEQPQKSLDVGAFMSKPVYILVSALHTIRA